ncbi:MAG: hypothetical protein QNJ14_10355 [Woeseiaceae bacterium]|nr:hypothetical protein [Woeseiaceae bacterium]
MNTLSTKWSGTDPPGVSQRAPKCVFCGAVAGLVVALTAFFVGSTYYAAVSELCVTSCAALGSFMTIVLSQPIALVGAVVGAILGGGYAIVCRKKSREKAD